MLKMFEIESGGMLGQMYGSKLQHWISDRYGVTGKEWHMKASPPHFQSREA